MTKKVAELLKRVIHARFNEEHPNDMWIEVGYINGVNPRTAKVLIDLEIVESRGREAGGTEIKLVTEFLNGKKVWV